ncbi:hypothetical protein PILCRDRAFT_821601 [Piloderma croceum F 1598]|uniref:Uncharacterized protein n=1 Tax=Piloderma croceum (strain F 1598) TaxID=765440 RepID=A0A0C3B4P3_PILCF|nr:hypothetical protein PILCRDRAFT_821601 [Piloderma croceum F 1598]
MIPNLPNSPWPNALGTHILPTPFQVGDIQRAIVQADTNIALIDQEIARINELLAHVELRRAEMCRYGATHRALLAPVRQCPDEILSEIFIHCNSISEEKDRIYTGMKKRRMPWLVSDICRRWREVALRTPALWSDIQLVHSESRNSAQRVAEMARDWLRRTDISRPISFSIHSHSGASLPDFTNFILPVILPASNRWQHLRLDLSADKIHRLSPIKGALSSLKSLRANSDSMSLLTNEWDIFEIAPKLFHVYIKCQRGSGGFALPWTQLTDVSFNSGLSLDECLTIINDCPNLVSCEFDSAARGVAATSRFCQNLIHHAHLRNLKLSTYVNPRAFFNCLSTPELHTIHIIDLSNCVFYNAITDFLLRSSCTIVTFKWYTLVSSTKGVIRVFRAMPDLEELSVNCKTDCRRHLLLNLTLDPSADENSYLCPRLRTIRLHSLNSFEIPGPVLEFVKSRRPMCLSESQCVVPLRSVVLEMTMKVQDKEFLEEVDILQEEGIDIRVVIC